jgi:type I restriction-modification system DNA methylase subunit
MILSDDIKKVIEEEYNSWMDCQYNGKDKKERQKMSQFFTPPPLTIKMLEKFESITNKSILDPTAGAGGLIAAAIIAGANPKMCYGIELDNEILTVCKKRLAKLGVPPCNLIQGDALDSTNYDKFVECSFDTFAIVYKIDNNNIEIGVYTPKHKYKNMSVSRDKANNILMQLKQKNIKIFKL